MNQNTEPITQLCCLFFFFLILDFLFLFVFSCFCSEEQQQEIEFWKKNKLKENDGKLILFI